MFEKVTEAAEYAVSRVSRRAALGRLGRLGLTLAGMIAGLCAFPSSAEASKRLKCCEYVQFRSGEPYAYFVCTTGGCPKGYGEFVGWHRVENCAQCGY